MAKSKSKSKSTSDFKYLESQKLLDAANTLKACIKEYNSVIARIRRANSALNLSWDGEGGKAYEKDYSVIFQQLSDIGDIMYDLYDALVDADAIYVQTDEEVAKNFTM